MQIPMIRRAGPIKDPTGDPGRKITALLPDFFHAYSNSSAQSELAELNEGHPILDRFVKRGLITHHDERTALEALARTG